MVDMAEKIRIILIKRGISISELADRLGTSRANLSAKLKRNNFNTSDLMEIAEKLDCDFSAEFTLRDTGEKI